MAHVTLLLDWLDRERVGELTRALMTSPGVTRVYIDTSTEAVFVEHAADRTTGAQLSRVIERFGLRVRSIVV